MATYLNISIEKNPEKIVPIASHGRPAWILSDFHLAAGLNDNGNYEGTENFFYDILSGILSTASAKASNIGGLTSHHLTVIIYLLKTLLHLCHPFYCSITDERHQQQR